MKSVIISIIAKDEENARKILRVADKTARPVTIASNNRTTTFQLRVQSEKAFLALMVARKADLLYISDGEKFSVYGYENGKPKKYFGKTFESEGRAPTDALRSG